VPSYAYLESDWRREAIRTNLWVVPAFGIVAVVALFAVTYSVDRAAYNGHLQLPSWVSLAKVLAIPAMTTGSWIIVAM